MTDNSSNAAGKARKIITTACTPCRKRKSRCDGESPVCKMCHIYNTAEICTYDKYSDRRKLRTKHQAEAMENRVKNLEHSITRLRTCRPDEIAEVVRLIRADTAHEPSATPSSDGQNDEPQLAQLVEDLHFEDDGEVHYYGASSNLPVLGYPTSRQQPRSSIATSSLHNMSVENFYDPVMVEQLIELYFTWHHPYFHILDRRLFMRDREEAAREGFPWRKKRFYNEFLLNAILALASHMYPSDALRTDPRDPESAGEVYYERSRELLDAEGLRPSACTIQGCLIISAREAGLGRQSRGWLYSGIAFRVALDLGLHVNCEKLVHQGRMSAEEFYCRSITFWGAYLYDAGWSSYIGRPTSLPIPISTCLRPCKVDCPYVPTRSEVRVNLVFEHEIKLTLLLQKVVAIRTSIKEDIRQSLWQQLQEWHNNLRDHTDMIKVDDDSISPSELMLYLVFETTIILLFRDIVASSSPAVSFVDAKQEYINAAFRSLAILERHRSLYGLDKVTNMAIHLTFTVATTFLLALMDDPTPNSLIHHSLGRCLEFFLEIEQTWPAAGQPRRGIIAKMRRLNLQVPLIQMQPTTTQSWNDGQDAMNYAGSEALTDDQLGGFSADDYVNNSLDLRNTYSSMNNFRAIHQPGHPGDRLLETQALVYTSQDPQVYSSLSGPMF